MFIFNFNDMSEGVYQLANSTWLREDPTAESTYETFRMLLFGMLVKAMDRRELLN